jgi:hypothetical protein
MTDATKTNDERPGARGRSFSDYLRLPACQDCYEQKWYEPDMYRRLIAADIKSLAALQRWMRERYPPQHGVSNHFGSSPGGTQKIWAAYLEWSEKP